MTHPIRLAAAAPLWVMAVLLPGAGARAEPRLQDVLSAVTLSFAADGGFDRAVLTQNGDAGADLTIFRAVPAPDAAAAPLKPAFFKKDVAFSGQSWGTLPSLSVNGAGSLVIASENDAVGRDRWHQTLTVAYRDGAYRVIGITYDHRDTLDLSSGGSCDLNLSTGRGTAGGKPVTAKLSPIPLADWSDGKLPAACGG